LEHPGSSEKSRAIIGRSQRVAEEFMQVLDAK